MIDIQKQIDYWRNGSQEDWEVGHELVGLGRTRHGLFFAHLALEKMLKAHVCQATANLAPKIHNLLHKFRLEEFKSFVRRKVLSTLDIASRGVIWHKTKAWARVSEDTGFIFCNRIGKFEQGIIGDSNYTKIRDELIKKLDGR